MSEFGVIMASAAVAVGVLWWAQWRAAMRADARAAETAAVERAMSARKRRTAVAAYRRGQFRIVGRSLMDGERRT